MRALIGMLVVAALLVGGLLLSQRSAQTRPRRAEPERPGPAGLQPRVLPEEPEAGADAARAPAAPRRPEAGVGAAPDALAERAGSDAAERTRALRGLVTDGEGGPPLAGLALEVRRGRAPGPALARVVTDAAGRFETGPLPCAELHLRHAPDLDDPDRALQLWVRPATFALPPSDDGAPCERTFRVQRPTDVVVVDVVTDDGGPAVGAFVQLSFRAVDPDTGGALSSGGAAVTGARGRARVGLYDSAGFERGELFARAPDGTVSEVLALDASFLHGPHRLRLGPACALVVRAYWSDGRPAAGRDVRLFGPRDFPRPGEPERFAGVTDETGTCALGGLYPARYEVRVENPRALGAASGSVTLHRGETGALELELGSGARRLAAAGRVLDEAGAPLSGVELAFRADDGWAEETETDARGRFECWAEPCEVLRIALDVLPHGDVFEPGALEVPFGARDLEFRRRARAAPVRFALHVSDRATGAPLDLVFLTFDRGPEREQWSNTYAPRELYVVEASSETRCKVARRGYVVRTVALLDALERASGDPPRLEVALDRGLSHTVQVLDAETRAPLSGVTFTAPDVAAVRTGVDGRARLEANRWATFAVSCEGYEPAEWDPSEELLFPHGPLLLSPR